MKHSSAKTHARHRNPLLNIPIARRLAYGFLIPALIASIALGSIGVRSAQLLSQESLFYQSLIHTYTSLTTATTYLQQMHTTLEGTLVDASSTDPAPETLQEDQNALQGFTRQYNTMIEDNVQQDLLDQHADLAGLFSESGHGNQIEQQRLLSQQVIKTWQTYRTVQAQILHAALTGNMHKAHELEYSQAELDLAASMNALNSLIQFDGHLVNSVRDATTVEENKLLVTTLLAALCVLIGIAIVGWLVSSTLVQRLHQLRQVVQAIEKGQVNARIAVTGRDEIAEVSTSVNTMLNTIVGLLEETRFQRDELVRAAELQRLHLELQNKHDELNVANSRLAALAVTDPLTGLPNHRAVMKRVEEELVQCQQLETTCAILFIDLDHFKRVNDTWGHQAGDAILREASSRFKNNVRSEDFVGRYGGEEFAIVLSNTDLIEARHVAERLRKAMADFPCLWDLDEAEKIEQATISIPITASIGVAIYAQHGSSREALIEAADHAMYHAKHTGRNRVCTAGEENVLAQTLLPAASHVQPASESAAAKALAAVASLHDQGTGAHAQRMVQLAEDTARMLGRTESEIHLIRLAALLHDIGKVGIPDSILNKPGPLTADEWAIMRHHPKIGRQILLEAGGRFEILSHIVVAHHERWDGSGYPYGLAQDAIPLGARILAVVDSYDAMTSERPYRGPIPIAEAKAELQRCAGTQYDPHVVAAFLQVLAEYSSATPATTSSSAGEQAEVIPM